MPDLMIYGAYGYTGALIAREAVRRGMRPILAGRDVGKMVALGRELGVEHRAFSLNSPGTLDENLRGVRVVLHAAGPFSRTARPMVEACLRKRIPYLDITGEEAVLEWIAEQDTAAKNAGVTLMPGVGFDVVPSDCLAVHLKRRLPSATHLALGFQSSGRLSHGTALTVLESLPHGGVVREGGVLRRVPAAWKTRVIDFGAGPTPAMTIPWGDVATAYRSTGIPNIEVYLAAPWGTRLAARLSRGFGWLLGSSWVRSRWKGRLDRGPAGPTEEERRRSRSLMWAEVSDEAGRRAVARQQTPDGYDLTVLTSLAITERVLAGTVATGFQTPGLAFGADFILDIPGVVRIDE